MDRPKPNLEKSCEPSEQGNQWAKAQLEICEYITHLRGFPHLECLTLASWLQVRGKMISYSRLILTKRLVMLCNKMRVNMNTSHYVDL